MLPDSLEPVPLNAYSNAQVASFIVPGNLLVVGFTVTNNTASAQLVQAFNNSALPADGAVPLFSASVPANNALAFAFTPQGRWFPSGLVLCNSSTVATKTIGSANCLFDVQYYALSEEEQDEA